MKLQKAINNLFKIKAIIRRDRWGRVAVNKSTLMRAAIDLLKNKGPLAAHEIADHLGVCCMHARTQAITPLREWGILRAVPVYRGSRGRPSHTYVLSGSHRRLFARMRDYMAL